MCALVTGVQPCALPICALFASLGKDVVIREQVTLERRLAPLPTASLSWPRPQLEALRGVGLRRIGDLFALPRNAFARRFGAAALLELDRLRGRAAEPALAIAPPATFKRRFELVSEIDHVEALLFPLRRLAFELQAWLRTRDLGEIGRAHV